MSPALPHAGWIHFPDQADMNAPRLAQPALPQIKPARMPRNISNIIRQFGHRLSYRVSSDFADSVGSGTWGGWSPDPAPLHASFALCSTATLDIFATTGGATIAIDVPAVIISHGPNGAGAYTPQGIQIARGSNTDEMENSDNGINLNYVEHPPTTGYDDQLVWISNPLLMSRMVAAGVCPRPGARSYPAGRPPARCRHPAGSGEGDPPR